jgi:hypothetical protein
MLWPMQFVALRRVVSRITKFRKSVELRNQAFAGGKKSEKKKPKQRRIVTFTYLGLLRELRLN